MSLNLLLDGIAVGLEVVGVGVILSGALFATVVFLRTVVRGEALDGAYHRFRRVLGQGIMLGLEFLVAADIVGTVIIDPTFSSLGVLALIVGVRTFLSFALEVEINGRWPWRAHRISGAEARSSAAESPAT